MSQDMWRLFWAIDIPVNIKTEMGEIINDLKTADGGAVRWVNPIGIHVTLRFLGDTDVNIIDNLVDEVEQSLQGIPPFHFQLGGFGCFPNLRNPRVTWIGVTTGVEELSEIANRIESKVREFGFKAETRGFKPHLTLGRIKRALHNNKLQDKLSKLEYESDQIIAFEVCLIRSHLTPQGAKYETIDRITLR